MKLLDVPAYPLTAEEHAKLNEWAASFAKRVEEEMLTLDEQEGDTHEICSPLDGN